LRFKRRIAGTAVGVCLALPCLPLFAHLPAVLWTMAALAMIAYAITAPERYDLACGAVSFALVCALAASGNGSLEVVLARVWETGLGGTLAVLSATLVRWLPGRQA